MKFIFPKNYDFKSKLFGFVDYSTAIIDGLIALVLYLISSIVFDSIIYKIYFFISLFLPILLLSIFGFQKENIFEVFSYMFYFTFHNHVFLFKKTLSINAQQKEKVSPAKAYILRLWRFFTKTF